jgi:uncharacterized repeat protein (TIGR01451 family)
LVSATATDPSGNTSEFSLATEVQQGQVADIEVTTVANSDPTTLGSSVTFTTTVRNNGPSGANGVSLVQTLPLSFTFDSATAPAVFVNGSIVANLGALALGATVTIEIVATPGAIGVFSSTATVISNEIDDEPTNNSASLTTTVNIPADLRVTLDADPPSGVSVGSDQSYVGVVTNNGPGIATDVVVTHTLPSGTEFVFASTGQGTFIVTQTPLETTVTFTVGTINPGVSVATRVTLTANSVGEITHRVEVAGFELDPDGSNNAAEVTVPIAPAADVRLSMVANPEPALINQPVTYVVTIENAGPSVATDVVIENPLPDSLSFNSTTISGLVGTLETIGQTVRLTIPMLAAGSIGTWNIVATPTDAGVILNQASIVSQGVFDPDASNNSALATSTISPADLSITMEGNPSPVAVGEVLTYTITVTNHGPGEASNIRVDNILPSGVSLQPITPPPGGTVITDEGSFSVLIPALSVMSSVVIVAQVQVNASTSLVNTATVSSDSIDLVFDNNFASVTVDAGPADVGLTVTASTQTLLAGDLLTYTAVVTNHGPFVASGIQLLDPLPTDMNFESATTTQGSVSLVNGVVTANLGGLVVGATARVEIRVRPSVGKTYVNTFSVVSGQVDPVPNNDFATITTNVSNAPGSLGFALSSFSVNENASEATITVTRTQGTGGTVTVAFAASGGSALPGLNYTPVQGSLTFLDGVTTQSFSVPLIHDSQVTGPLSVELFLAFPGGGAILGANATATLLIQNVDLDTTAPTVTDLFFVGAPRRPSHVVLTFSEALNPISANNPANYIITSTSRGRSRVLPVVSAIYDGVSSVFLATSTPLPFNQFIQVTVNGDPGGVTDAAGNLVDGDRNLSAGGDFRATLIRSTNATYSDRNGDTVNLRVSQGGSFDLYRTNSGDGQVLRVYGTPRRTTLTGSVRRGRAGGDGRTSLHRLIGASVGQVVSRLTTPPFFLTELINLTVAGNPRR